MNRVVEIFFVFGAEITGKKNACAGGQASKKAHQQPGDIFAGGDGGQSGGADEIAHHNAVYAVIKVLEYMAH